MDTQGFLYDSPVIFEEIFTSLWNKSILCNVVSRSMARFSVIRTVFSVIGTVFSGILSVFGGIGCEFSFRTEAVNRTNTANFFL